MEDFNKMLDEALATAKRIVGEDAHIEYDGAAVMPWNVTALCVGGRKIVGSGVSPMAAVALSCSCFRRSTEEHKESCNLKSKTFCTGGKKK